MQHCRIGTVRMKRGNVLWWDGVTRLDLSPAHVLASALERNLAGVVVLGHTAEGEEHFASSYSDGSEIVWLLERARYRLMQVVA